jgi:dTDP-4-amino-4,6-dideoxygalactose transaminase
MVDAVWREAAAVNELRVFEQLHDEIVSVPLWEGMPEKAIERITEELNR